MKKDKWRDNPDNLPRWKRLAPALPDAQPSSVPRDPLSGERLQKILAQAGIASRRAAEELIAAGRVTVNGEVVKEMGVRADPASDSIAVDGKPLKVRAGTAQAQKFVYIALNKPLGVVSTVKDPEGRPTVLSLLPSARLTEQGIRLYPVGRLDTDSTGLLLLTNDGDLTFRLTHPRYAVDKEYQVIVRGRPNGEALGKLRDGVMIEGGITAPAKVDVLGRTEGNTTLRITIHEGRKRQVRLMCAAVGHPVIELTRVRFGPIELGDLEPGKWRNLAVHESHALRKAVKLKPAASSQVANPTPPAPAPARVNARTRPSVRARSAADPRTGATGAPTRTRPAGTSRSERPRQNGIGNRTTSTTETRPGSARTGTRNPPARETGSRSSTGARTGTGPAPRPATRGPSSPPRSRSAPTPRTGAARPPSQSRRAGPQPPRNNTTNRRGR